MIEEPKTIDYTTLDSAKSLSQILTKLVSGERCERCGLRMRHKNKKWCDRCIDAFYMAKERFNNPQKWLKSLENLMGTLYMDADIEHIDEPYRTQVSEAKDDIYLWGDVGRGKTYLMAALLKLRFLQGSDGQRINFDDFCSGLRSTMNSRDGQSEYDIVKGLSNLDILVIDDIGLRSKQETDFAYVTLYTILNKRQESRLPTYISTNKSIIDLAKTFDARIASRLQTATVIHMDGPDRRKQKR